MSNHKKDLRYFRNIPFITNWGLKIIIVYIVNQHDKNKSDSYSFTYTKTNL